MDMKKKDKLKIPRIILALLTVVLVLYGTFFISSYAGVSTGVIFFVITALITVLILFLGNKHSKTAFILGIIYLAVLLALSVTGYKADQKLSGMEAAPEYEVVQIVAMKDSNITGEDSFESYKLGYSSNDPNAYNECSDILKEHEKKVYKTKPSKDIYHSYELLKKNNLQLMLLTGVSRGELKEKYPDYQKETVVIFEKKYVKNEVKAKYVDIEKEPCVLYLQGADLSSGDNINATGRGDCNVLLTINPKTKKVNMQVIPRDTFVNIPSMGGRSKLSYSGGWGGIQSSIESIEEEFGIDINFYAKINFDGVMDLVDALGGVKVYSQYDFYGGGYHFVQGYNELNGDQALYFVRERKSLPLNELSRGRNQMAMIKAILNKFAENPDYDSAMAVLDKLSENFVTNIPKKDYLKTFNVVVDLLPALEKMEPKSMEGE